MTVPGPELDPLAQRLLILERQSRRLTGLVALLSVGFLVVLLGQLLPGKPVHEARGFLVRDAHGTARAALTLLDDGSPALRLNGADGKVRALWLVRPDESVALRLKRPEGLTVAELMLDPDGSPHLLLGGRDGRTRTAVGVAEDGAPALLVRDRELRRVWSAP
jgi:hypothetical protein